MEEICTCEVEVEMKCDDYIFVYMVGRIVHWFFSQLYMDFTLKRKKRQIVHGNGRNRKYQYAAHFLMKDYQVRRSFGR